MQRVIEEILLRQELDDFFRINENCTIKIQPAAPRPLVIKKYSGRVIILEDDTSDFLTIKCDPSGPEIEFEILDDGTWANASLREEYSRRGKRAIEYVEGCRVVRPVRQRRQQKFAAEWSRKLLTRKYASGILRYARKW